MLRAPPAPLLRLLPAALALLASAPHYASASPAPFALAPLAPLAPLAGELVYATCNLPQCSVLEFALFHLANASSEDLFDFPTRDFEDGYVADNILDGDELIISLQYDARPQQGYLLSFDLAARKVIGGFNSSQCFSMWLDPSDATRDRILCLALEPSCDGGSQCTELRHISRSKHTDTLVASFLPNFAPYTVSCLDTRGAGVIYSTFGPLTTGHNVLAAIDPKTGKVLAQPTFPISTAYIELEFDASSGKIYGVIEDATDGAFVGTVDPQTGAATPISAQARLNTTQWNQFNTISTIAPEIDTLFFTAFHYMVPGPPPSDPVLHLIGASLTTGAINYDEVVTNPFCEILWLPKTGARLPAPSAPAPLAATAPPAARAPLPGAQLQAAVDAAIASGAASLSLEPLATYAFGAASLTLRGAARFALEGAGATLVFAPGYGVLVRESRDSAVRNLTVAYDPPCFTQGVIVANDASKGTVDVRLDAGYPSPDAAAPETAYFGSSEIKLQFWDPSTRLRVPGQSPACVVTVVGPVAGQAGVWRVGNACAVPQGVPGMLATISPRIGATFDIPQFYRGQAWWVHGSVNILSEDVTLTGSGNFAILEWGGGGGHTYRRVALTRAGSNLLSSNTDGFHSFSVGAGPHIDSCHISFMGDDALNFHNRVAVVLAVVGDGGSSVQIVDLSDVPSPDAAQPPVSALADLVPGDALRFMTAAQRTPHGTGAVASVTRVADPAVLAAARALAAALPGVSVDPAAVVVWEVALVGGVGASGITANDIVQFDRRAVAGGLVENSVFTDAYDGVFRLQAANTTLRNNTWQRTAWKLQVVYDPGWKEGSTDVANVLVDSNVFRAILAPPATTMDEILQIDGNVQNVTLTGNSVYTA